MPDEDTERIQDEPESISQEGAEVVISAVSEATAKVLGQAQVTLGNTQLAQKLVFLGALKTVAAMASFGGLNENEYAKVSRRAYKIVKRLEKVAKEMIDEDVKDILP